MINANDQRINILRKITGNVHNNSLLMPNSKEVNELGGYLTHFC